MNGQGKLSRHIIFNCAMLCIRTAIADVACLHGMMDVTHQYCIEMDKDSYFFLGLVAPPLWVFFNTVYVCEILTGRGTCHSGGLRSENA